VEALVGSAVHEHLEDSAESDHGDLIVRVKIQADQLVVELKLGTSNDPPNAVDNERRVVRIPWKKTPMKRRRDIVVSASVAPHDCRLIRAEISAPPINSRSGRGGSSHAHPIFIRQQTTVIKANQAVDTVGLTSAPAP
jgi:hypothetical protein